jgi:hypothetical protein
MNAKQFFAIFNQPDPDYDDQEQQIESLDQLADDELSDQEITTFFKQDSIFSSFFTRQEIRQSLALGLREELIEVYRLRKEYD